MSKENNITAVITGVGMYVPDKVLDNKWFEERLDTSDEWITTRTGIKERRILEEGASSDLGARAVKDLLESTNTDPEEIDLILVATVTPDMFFPSTACLIMHKAGLSNAWGFDVSAACSGFIFTLKTASDMVKAGTAKKVIVVGADKMSAITDYTDRNTSILFGDAGSAVLLEPSEDPQYGIQDTITYCDGSGYDTLHQKGGGSLNPATHETVDEKMHYIYQNGKAVFKVAVKGMADVSEEMMKKHNLTADDLAWLVPHQANTRIINATAQRANLPKEKVMLNIDKYGNTTAATIPMCLTEYYRDGKVKKGDKLILTAFGGGYTWGSMYVVWGID